MRARIVASVVTAALVLLGTAGCNFFAPQATLKSYAPSDGVEATVGSLDVRNAMLITGDGTDASLVAVLLNTGDKSLDVTLQYHEKAGDETSPRDSKTVRVDAHQTVRIGWEGEQIVLAGIDAAAGSMMPVYVQYGEEPGKQLLIPVLDGTLPEYAALVPTGVPSP